MKPAFKHILCIFCIALCSAYIKPCRAGENDSLKSQRSFIGNILYGFKTSFGKDTTGRRTSITVLNTKKLLPHEGKIIRYIGTRQLGFESNITDSAGTIIYFGTRILNALHSRSKDQTILRHVYLHEGTSFNPYLVADNERHLRTLGFIQDARIQVRPVGSDSVDLLIITKDLFAYAPSVGGMGPLRQRAGISNINILGRGQRASFTVLHDSRRDPEWGFEAGYGYSSMGNSFINASLNAGKITRNIYDRREDEEFYMLQLDRPLVSQYKRMAGGFAIGKGRSLNRFPNYYGGDYYRYNYGLVDIWAGYNIGARKYLNDQILHTKKFLAFRYFRYHFFDTPYQVEDTLFDQRFNSRQGALVSLTLFRQYYYKTQYIYGFGITEDVPDGFNISLTTGWYKQLNLSRPYFGADAYKYMVTGKNDLAGLFLRTGTFVHQGALQDLSILAGASYFSRVLNLGNIRMRQHFRASYSTIINRTALNPLRVNNALGIRNFSSDLASGNCRLVFRTESFLFLEQKYFGFRLAPFFGGDLAWLSKNRLVSDSDGLFMAVGGGLRMRNENLVFGTFEVRGLVIPRKLAGDNMFKISAAFNLQFRYNGSYVSKPDIVELNSDANNDIF
jgi:hypothetical protein